MTVAGVTSQELFSIETQQDLLVAPLYVASAALATLRVVETRATSVYLPSVTADIAEWYSDLDVIAESTAAASELEVTPKKVAALRTISNEAVSDASAAQILGQALVSELAAAVDKAFFAVNGGGAKGPTGIDSFVGTGAIVAPWTNLGGVIDAIAQIETAGGVAGAIYMSPTLWATLSKLESTSTNLPFLTGPLNGAANAIERRLLGVPVMVSKYVEPNTAWAVDVQRTLAIVRLPFDVQVDSSAGFTRDATVVRAIGRVEFASLYPSTIVKIATV